FAVAADATFQRFVRMDKHGALTVFRLTAQGEEVIARPPIHGRPPFMGLWISPDGRFVVYGHSPPSARTAGAVRIWKVDGPEPTIYADDPAGVQFGAFTFPPDGRRLAIGHSDGTVSVYDLETPKPPQRLRVGQAPNALAFHPRENILAVACRDLIR